MNAAIEARRTPSNSSASYPLRQSEQPLGESYAPRTIEFMPGLPYATWEEDHVEIGTREWRVLTHEEERHLFRQMNLAYFQASCLREKNLGDCDAITAAEIQRLMQRADSIREELAQAFYKLNFSIASRYANPIYTFDELVCEGHFTLLRAIARFNPERGYRFSTYAMHAIRRRIFRFMQQRQRQRRGTEGWSDAATPVEVEVGKKRSLAYEQTLTAATAAVERLLPELSPRERFVVRARFGWGREFEPRTLQQIADELGVSRERIRQLEERALRKLRKLAATLDIEL